MSGEPESGAERWRILIVDDEPSVRLLLKKLFSREHEVTTAAAGDEAIELLRVNDYDLILTDKNLPGAGGVEIARFARGRLPDACVVLITGYASQESADQLIGLVDDYIPKPFHIQPMRERLRDLMARRRRLASRPEPQQAPAAAHKKVLVLEPDPAERSRLEETLARLGHQVVASADAESLTAHADLQAVVVSTRLCSHELYREIWRRQARSTDFNVVVTSEGESLDGSMAALSLGAEGRLVYPAEPAMIEEVLARALGTPRQVS